jgi:cardiolipin synthase
MPELTSWIGAHVGAALAIIFTLNVIFVAFIILLENREPERAFVWFLVLFTFPVIGFVLYLFFGHNWHRKSYEERRRSAFVTEQRKMQAAAEVATLPDATPLEARLVYGAMVATGFAPTRGNRVQVLTDGHVKFPRLIAALRNARHAIDMEYYIFRYDNLGREIIEILKNKARAGVRVRFMADGYGSIGLGRKAFGDMRDAGVQAHYFAPLITLFYFFKANFRDHRKIVVVDNEIAFTGGINVGDEYLGKSARGPWRDTSVELRGPCVQQFSELFEEAWNRTTGSKACEFPPGPKPFEDGETVTVVPSGPDADWFAIQRLYLEMINAAEQRVIIQTPYFIPDTGILSAMTNAALRGVDVQIVVPRYPDNQFLRWVANTYLSDILRAGGRVFEYTVGFPHQKVIVTDDRIATTGTCNIDIRSLQLDFEVNILTSDPRTVRHLLEDYEHDLNISEELTYDRYLTRPFIHRVRDSLARLIAPLL